MSTQLFSAGILDYSIGAQRFLAVANTTGQALVQKHIQGDWGNFGSYQKTQAGQNNRKMSGQEPSQAQLNKLAIDNNRGRVWSEYEIGEQKIWLITENIGAKGKATRLVLPRECN
ncbi:MAG: hypothetical protein F6K19_47720 [Cyanothece sp. SIO1E1]|nr:hypothetical protein [Cyanothece sp. SIO1E1]